jgi:hypothetical protein
VKFKAKEYPLSASKNTGDSVGSRDKLIGIPLDPPFFGWTTSLKVHKNENFLAPILKLYVFVVS